ncbi:hypothetical protein M758_4G186500 [Ceratodon purpureus]|uniref:Uncharacterized protein n=1 Tax=Ceratodon purpureus TaxID=3225 RepID=A0A8T0IA60_CERPU|nr:hypothetical protein KC19_4G183700 [Ceratodon purpureus]KAG0620067.1 hypothetical protein M758_4G186500 [Ceratodon purpureus]
MPLKSIVLVLSIRMAFRASGVPQYFVLYSNVLRRYSLELYFSYLFSIKTCSVLEFR